MVTIKVPVQAYILNLFPENVRGRSLSDPRQPVASAKGQQLRSLANGLAVTSFWSVEDIYEAFAGANAVWAQAMIEFIPVAIAKRSEAVPADEDGMWIAFVNRLRPAQRNRRGLRIRSSVGRRGMGRRTHRHRLRPKG